MPYIGNPPAEAYTNTVKDSFNGDGSTVAFTMSQPSLTNDVRVVVENVVQDPTVAYSCSGTTLTFTSAPPVGTSNIYVVHLGPAVMTTLPPAEIAQATTFNSNVSVGGNLIVDTNTLYVDSANNKVGIGTSSPSALIHASGAAASGGAVEIRLEDTAASSNSRLMRTGSAYSYAGVGANETWLYHAGAGTINIGPDGAGTVKIVNGGSERMRITTDKVQFNVDAKVDADNARDLGAGGARWKDLYLSGGVYLGGTGAANHLNDYETGTWTVNIYKGGGALAVNSRYAYYIKVGGLLFLTFYWYSNTATTTGSSSWTLQGLPFSIGATAAANFMPNGYLTLNSTANNDSHRWQANSSTILTLYGSQSTTNNTSGVIEFSGTGVFYI